MNLRALGLVAVGTEGGVARAGADVAGGSRRHAVAPGAARLAGPVAHFLPRRSRAPPRARVPAICTREQKPPVGRRTSKERKGVIRIGIGCWK